MCGISTAGLMGFEWVIKWYGFRMLTKLHLLQVENQLENHNKL